MASGPFASPFANSAIQRAAVLSYAVVEEVHGLLDQPFIPRRVNPRVRRLGVAGLIFFGTLISTLGKLAYEIEAIGRDGTKRPFQKPWCLVLLMFVGMALNLPLSLFLDLVRRSKRRFTKVISRRQPVSAEPLYSPLLQYDSADDDELYNAPMVYSPLSVSTSRPGRFTLLDKQLLLLLVPTLFDLLGAALLNIGLLAVTASATAMLRQSLLLWAALMGVGLFKKKLNQLHWAGVGGCLVGLSMVCAASLASGFVGSTASEHRGTMAIGICLILASQLLAACQVLIDQSWYTGRLALSPLKVVGCEGLLGAAITVLLLLLLDASSIGSEGWGLSEDSWDSILMIIRSPLLLVLLAAYTGSLQAYNICGMAVSGELSAVDTTLLQAVRTLFVWIINLLIYAVATALTPDTADQSQLINHSRSGAPGLAAATAVHTAAGGMQQLQRQGLLQQLLQGWQASSSTWDGGAVAASEAAASAVTAAAAGVLPGEPWSRWSFLQAAGFIILVTAAITYSKGDNERLRKQMEEEAALIMLDQPPSVAASNAPNRFFTTHMDIDTAAYLRSFARQRDNEVLYGITPVPSVQGPESSYREGLRNSREGREGLEPLLSPGASGLWEDQGSGQQLDPASQSSTLGSRPSTGGRQWSRVLRWPGSQASQALAASDAPGGHVVNLEAAFEDNRQTTGQQEQELREIMSGDEGWQSHSGPTATAAAPAAEPPATPETLLRDAANKLDAATSVNNVVAPLPPADYAQQQLGGQHSNKAGRSPRDVKVSEAPVAQPIASVELAPAAATAADEGAGPVAEV